MDLQTTPLKQRVITLYPGILLAAIMALAAQYVADHYGAPAMLMALLFGMSMSSLSSEKTVMSEGLRFTASHILKLGIVLLGSQISSDIVTILGWKTIMLVIAAVAATLLFGYMLGKSLKKTTAFALLTAGAVSICGASAAIAISAILPRDADSDKSLLFTILSVTILSTVAMILYPILLGLAGYDATRAGIFIGATIHDVAQVIGAGFSVSNQVGETAVLVKLMRVTLLVPVVVCLSLMFRKTSATAAGKAFPLFIGGFVVLAGLNSLGLLSRAITEVTGDLSRWALLAALVAAGARTNLREILAFGGSATLLVILETVFLAGVVFCALALWF